MKACLEEIIEVLERQYEKYFECEITEQLRKETESARSHHIDAEEIMGMFSATKKKSPYVTLCYNFLQNEGTDKQDFKVL